MKNLDKQLLNVMKTIEGNGSFVSSGTRNFTHPGLQLEGIGEIGLPLNPIQIKEIIKIAQKAPFGKGRQTITDTSVRSAWEIDAGQLSFGNKDWEKSIEKIIKAVKKGLGIENQLVTASLYKMLIYEPGDFFLPHKDSEKEKGMFATLVVGLPSPHTGGELTIRFDGREETIGMSSAASSYKIPYIAFFADCEHEIKPVTSGYRVCLVYNLVQSGGTKKIGGPQFMSQTRKMAELFQSMANSMEYWPKAVLLGHQYTPANFSLAHLKHHDRPRAEALMEAAETAGYFARLGLVTHYKMGELEGGDYYYGYGRRPYYEEKGPSEGTLGEVYEEYTTIEHWADEEAPGLGGAPIREENILTEFEMGIGTPIEQEEEGYTGNAGMTIEYWYHYGALILWPKKHHARLLESLSVPVRLQWLEYYLRHWKDAELNPQEYARQLLASFKVDAILEEKRYEAVDCSVVADAFARLGDAAFLKKHGEALLTAVFDKIKINNWLALLQSFSPPVFHPIFQNTADTDDVFVVRHLSDILMALEELGLVALEPFTLHHIQQLPEYLRNVQLHQLKETFYYYGSDRSNRKEAAAATIENVLALSSHTETNTDWIKGVLERITGPMPRKYVNQVLVPILLSGKYNGRVLAQALYEACLQDLKARTAVKPSPPSDWARKTPESSSNQKIWEILRPFLSSPTQQVFDYQRNQSYRTEMERAIKSVQIDLKMETIRKGSPHTLRLIKTQAAYERTLKKWKEDVAILERLIEAGLG